MTTEVFKIPLTNTPQKFDLTLSGKNLSIVLQYNSYMPNWTISLIDRQTQTPLVLQLPLITGANLLEQYGFLEIGGELHVFTDGDPDSIPTFQNLGVESNLYYLVENNNV
jgi:hypothetical protein